MKQIFELRITGDVPDDNDDLGPEAQVMCKEHAAEIVAALKTLGLREVVATRRIVRKKDAGGSVSGPRLVQPAAE